MQSAAAVRDRSPGASLVPSAGRGLLGLRGFRRASPAARSAAAAARKLNEASECGAALGIPKVALLFLTPGDMPLEQVCPFPLRTVENMLLLCTQRCSQELKRKRVRVAPARLLMIKTRIDGC